MGKPNHPAAVIFDWDLTLSDHYPRSIVSGAENIFRGMNPKPTGSKLAAISNFLLPEAGRAALVGSYYRLTNAKAMRHARDTLEQLLDHEIPVFVISNAPHAAAEAAMRRQFGPAIADQIPVYGSKQDGSLYKPHAEAFHRPLLEHGITPDRHVVVVGDRAYYDYIGAYEAGLTPVLFNPSPAEARTAFRHAKFHGFPFHAVRSHPELQDLLQSFMSDGVQTSYRHLVRSAPNPHSMAR